MFVSEDSYLKLTNNACMSVRRRYRGEDMNSQNKKPKWAINIQKNAQLTSNLIVGIFFHLHQNTQKCVSRTIPRVSKVMGGRKLSYSAGGM